MATPSSSAVKPEPGRGIRSPARDAFESYGTSGRVLCNALVHCMNPTVPIRLVSDHLEILSLRVTFPLLFPGTALPTPFSNLAADVILKKEQCKPYWSQPPGLHTSKFRWELFGGGPGNPLLIYKKSMAPKVPGIL